jgi:hypothetical protein
MSIVSWLSESCPVVPLPNPPNFLSLLTRTISNRKLLGAEKNQCSSAHIIVAQTEFRTSITAFRRAFSGAPKIPNHSQRRLEAQLPTWLPQGPHLTGWFCRQLHLRRVVANACDASSELIIVFD